MDIGKEVCGVLTLSAIKEQNKVGLVCFSDQKEAYVKSGKGSKHGYAIINELYKLKPKSTRTSINEALKFALELIKKRSVIIIISDFIDEGYDKNLRTLAKRHDLVAIHLKDDRETKMPKLGIIPIYDKESRKTIWVNTSSGEFEEEAGKPVYPGQRRPGEVFVAKMRSITCRSIPRTITSPSSSNSLNSEINLSKVSKKLSAVAGCWMMLCSLALMGQETKPKADFQKDSLKIGEIVPFTFSYIDRKNRPVIFPDSLYDFSPFELVSKEYYNTQSDSINSIDSAVYYLTTFEIDKVQKLSLPVYLVTGGDSLPVFSNVDSIKLWEVVLDLPDSVDLAETTAYIPVSREFNYPYLVIGLVLLGIIGLIVLLVWGQKHQEKRSSFTVCLKSWRSLSRVLKLRWANWRVIPPSHRLSRY